MATEFDSLFFDAFDDQLLMFGESIVYRKQNGTERTITAIVDRDPPAIFNPAGEVALTPSVVIRVHNDATYGISNTELETGGDKVTLAVRTSETASQRTIAKLLESDGGVVSLAIR